MAHGKMVRGVFILSLMTGVPLAQTQVLPGEQAPMYRGVDENLNPVDMADFIDGTPLLFLYTSAT